MTDLKTVRCKGPTCKAQIVWGMKTDGKSIPLDPNAPIWIQLMPETHWTRPSKELGMRVMVQHHATCRDVVQFSSGNDELRRLRKENSELLSAMMNLKYLIEDNHALRQRLIEHQGGQVAG